MDSTKDTGVDFVHRIMAEVKKLQDEVARMHLSYADIQSTLKHEKEQRDGDVSALHARISQERSAETLMRTNLEKKQEDFESKTRTWIGALGKDCVSTKEQIADLEASVADRAARQATADDARFTALETAMPRKCEVSEHNKLLDGLTSLRKEVERDRSTAAAALEKASAAAAADFKMVQERLTQVQQQTEAGRKVLTADLVTLHTKVDSVDMFVRTRAAASDLQALEPRVVEAEKGVQKLNEEVKIKASMTTVNSISDRLTHLTMDAQAAKARAEADKDSLANSIDKVDKSLAKTDRQVEADRDRTSSCMVALEKELGSKANRSETHLSLAEQAAKHDLIHSRTQEHSIRLEKIACDTERQLSRLESVESRHACMERQLCNKAEAMDHFTKAHTTDLLCNFYRREEIDAMLSRVWWRVGDMNKGRTISGVPFSTR